VAVAGVFMPWAGGVKLVPLTYGTTKVYLTEGGDKLVVASGGEIETQSGSTADYQESTTWTLPAGDKVKVDGATTAQTNTDGTLDINGASITADYSALNVASTQSSGAASGTDHYGAIFTLTQNDADGDMRGIKMTAAATANATTGSYEYGYYFDCAENTAASCTDGLLIESSGANTGLTDGVDVSAANIAYAVNIGSNPILGGDDQVTIGATDDTLIFTRNDAGSVTYTCADDDANAACIYDSGGTGDVQLGSADTGKATIYATDDLTLDLTSSAAGEDLIIDQDGNFDAGILISAEGSGTDAVKIETITNGGDIIITSVDNLQLTSSSASGLIDIDGTAGLVYSIGEDDTAADDIDIGSAKDDVDIEGEDITLDTSDDANVTVANDFTISVESAGGVIAFAGTAGSVFNLGTDDTTADDINIGSAKDDVLISGEDITLDTADDADALVADDFTFTMESAGGVWSATGTLGFVVNFCTDDTTADDINIGSAKDDVDMVGATIDLIGSVRLVDNSTEIDGSGTGNTVLTWKDYDATDDDNNATVTVNCTDTGLGTEDCDWTLAVQEAGAANNRIAVDADGGIDIGSAGNADVALIAGSDSLTLNGGDVTLSTDATHGNARAKNEFYGLPRIKNVGIGTMANGTTNTIITDIGDSETPATDWTAIDVDTVMSNDSTYYRQGTASLKMAIAATADATDGCTNALASGNQDWSDDESVGMWFYADRTLEAADLQLVISDSAPKDSTADFPAYTTANVWQWIEINIGGIANGDKDAITDLSIELSAAGAAKAALGAFNVYMDFIVKWDGAEEEALNLAIPYDGVLSLTVIDATNTSATCANIVEYTDYFVHYQSGNDAIVIISDQSNADKVGLALVAYN